MLRAYFTDMVLIIAGMKQFNCYCRVRFTAVIDSDLRQSRLTRTERSHLAGLVQQRIEQRVPAPYLTNKSWFAGMEFMWMSAC